MNHRVEALLREFRARFGSRGAVRVFQAPGRVNLIGEHTDYNGGFVFPGAIDRSILVAVRRNSKKVLNLRSINFPGAVTVPLDEIEYEVRHGWANYPKGVARMLQNQGYELVGMDMVFEGDIPLGGGLSSSAAMEVATCTAMASIAGVRLPRKSVPLIAQRAENEFIGMKCGIMDQFISTFGKKNHALFLDCRTLEFEHIPLDDPDYRIVISNTKKKHELVNSEYNARREQCERGVRILARHLPGVRQLRDITSQVFRKYRLELMPLIRKRCEHVIYENERVLEAKKCLTAGDLPKFGKLMDQSHVSLRDLYEVSCPELDAMVDFAHEVPGVLGSRMTGGGFGGCTVSLVHKDHTDEFVTQVSEKYRRRFNIEPEIYVCRLENGAREISL